MVLVRGHDTYTGIEIASETTWNVAAKSGFERVHPLLEQSLVVEATPLPRPQNLGGGSEPLSVFDVGRQLVRGSFTVYPTYNARWQFALDGQAHGGMEFVAPSLACNGASVNNATTHAHAPLPFNTKIGGTPSNTDEFIRGSATSAGGIGNGFTIRAWKGGPSLTPAAYCDTYTGCVITKRTWDQPDEDRPKVTYEFIGALATTGQIGAAGGPLTTIVSSPTFNDSPANWTNPNAIKLDDSVFATSVVADTALIAQTFTNIAAKAGSVGTVQGLQVSLDARNTVTAAVNAGGLNYLVGDVLTITGGTRSVATTLRVSAASAWTAAVIAGGTGYAINDLLTIVGGTKTSATIIRVTGVSSGVVTTVSIESQGAYTAHPSYPAATTSSPGTGCTITMGGGVASAVTIPLIGTYTVHPTYPAATTGGGNNALTTTITGSMTNFSFDVALSWDGGSTFTSLKSTSTLSATEATYTLGTGTTDLWGHAWTLGELTGSNTVQVKVTNKGSTLGSPTWSLDYVSLTVYILDLAMRPIQNDIVEIGLRDFRGSPAHATLPGICKIGEALSTSHSLSDIDTRGFRIVLDTHVDVASPFLTSLDSVERPGHVDLWELTGEVRSMLQQDYDATNRPHNLYRNAKKGSIRIRYVSATIIPGSSPSVGYAYDIFIPRVSFTADESFINDPQPTTRWPFTSINDTAYVGEWALGVDFHTPWMFQTTNGTSTAGAYGVLLGSEGTGDDHPLFAPEGGQMIQATTTMLPTTQTQTGTWGTDHNAWVAGGSVTVAAADGDTGTYGGFGFNSTIFVGAEISAVYVTLIGKKDEGGGTGTLSYTVEVSWDGGSNWTTPAVAGLELTTSLVTNYIGGANGTFGRDWLSHDDIADANFKVRITAVQTSITGTPANNLDYIEVTIKSANVPTW